jgi:hypothetical protein
VVETHEGKPGMRKLQIHKMGVSIFKVP